MKEKIKCKLCDYENLYINNFSKHVKRFHNINLQDYYIKYGIENEDYVICPFCGVYKRNLIRHFTYYHKEEYKQYKKEHPDYKPYIESYTDKMINSANKRWIPPDSNFIINNLNERKDLSLSISNPNYKIYGSEEMQNWAKDKLQSVLRSKNNLTNWNNKMHEYKGIRFRSVYEYNVAKQLDNYKIEYLHEDKIFPYILNDKIHMEVTDFYIPKAKLILEIKDKEFSNYIDYRPNTLEKIETMKSYIIKAGYNYELVHNEEILIEILSKYNLINN